MSEYLKNFSYIFIPFSIDRGEELKDFHRSVASGEVWEQINDEIKYLHRYVSERLVRADGDEINAYRYRLKDGEPVNSRYLTFREIPPFTLTAPFGVMLNTGRVISKA